MDREQFFQTILPQLGGPDNVSRQVWREGKLCVTVKDVGALHLEALEAAEAVSAVELDRGRVTVMTRGLEYKEEKEMAKGNKFDGLAEEILPLVGGKDNISMFAHCMTRLRFNLKQRDIVDAQKIEDLAGVMGTKWAGDQLQVIIGQSVGEAYSAICRKAGIPEQGAISENLDGGDKKQKKNPVVAVCEGIAGCITPLIPIFMASGLVKVVLVLANLIGVLPTDSSTYNILTFFGDAPLYFMPILVGYTSARKFGADASLAMGLCALLVYPNFMAAITGETAATIFGIPIYAATYTNMMFPSIMLVFVLSHVERFFKRVIPELVKVMLVPLLTCLIMIPLSVCLIAPAGAFLGSGITWLVESLYNGIGFLGVGVLAALYPLLIVTGMHSTLATVCISYFTQYGYDPFVIPANHICNFNQAAAALGVAIKSKKRSVKGIAGSSALTAFLAGVTEPALFGVNFRYRTPLIASVIGGFVGGCYAGLMGCRLVAMSGLGVFALAGFITSDIMNLVHYVIALVIAMTVTFILTLILYKDKKESEANAA